MTKKESCIVIMSINLCWSVAYIFMKNIPEDLPMFAYLTMITGIAAVLLGVVFCTQLKKTRWSTVWKGIVLGILINGVLIFDNLSVSRLAASTASILSTTTVIIMPVVLLFAKKLPDRNKLIGAGVIFIGILTKCGFLFDEIFSWGSLFMLCSSLLMVFYTLFADRFTKEETPINLTVIQMATCGLVNFAVWFIQEPTTFASVTYTKPMLSAIFVIAFFSEAYAHGALMIAQKYSDPMSVSVIFATEPILTLLLAAVIPGTFGSGETLSWYAVAGVVLIALGAMIASAEPKKRKVAKTVAYQ